MNANFNMSNNMQQNQQITAQNQVPNIPYQEELVNGCFLQKEQQISMNMQAMYFTKEIECENLKRERDILLRNKKRKETFAEIVIETSGSITLCQHFDYGRSEIMPFITNCKGKIHIAKVTFIELEVFEPYYLIQIGNACIFLTKRQLYNPQGLYNACVSLGINFNQSISENKVKKVLFRYITGLATNKLGSISLKILAGWNSDKKFLSQENCCLNKYLPDKKFPILDRSFKEEPANEEKFKVYFKELRKIHDWRERLIIMTFPFIGLISSLLDKYKNLKFYLNIVDAEGISEKWICGMMQIFNRENLTFYSLNMHDKEFEKFLQTFSDEVILLDGRELQSDTPYKKRVKEGLLLKGINFATKKEIFYTRKDQKFTAALCTLTREFRVGTDVINIFFPSKNIIDLTSEFLSERVFESVLTAVVHYIEENTEDVTFLIKKDRSFYDEKSYAPAIAYEILQNALKKYGISIKDEGDFSENIDFSKIFESQLSDETEDEIRKIFINTIRKGIGGIRGIEKKTAKEPDLNVVYYSDDMIYFPVALLRNIFAKVKLSKILERCLAEMKKSGDLISDSIETKVKKIQIAEQRFDTYAFEIQTFDKLGGAEFLDLLLKEEE